MTDNESTPRWPILITGIFIIAMFLIMTFITIFAWWGSCGGDGGSPFSAEASPMGEMCDTAYGKDGTPIASAAIGVVVLIVIGLGVAVKKRMMRILLVASLVGILIHGIMLVPAFRLEKDCTEEQRTTLPARECETYN